MARINLRTFAREVTLAEGGKVSVSVAQVAEVLHKGFARLATYPMGDVAELLARHRDRTHSPAWKRRR